MLKRLFLLLILGCLAGCSALNDINANMVRTNELMDENIVVTSNAQGIIQQNTAGVTRSTDSMIEFEDIIADNSAAVNRVLDEVQTHSHVLSVGVILLLALLFLPSLILVIFYFKFLRKMKTLTRK